MLVGVPVFEVLQNAAWSSSIRIYVTEEENSRLRILYLKQECPSIRTNRLYHRSPMQTEKSQPEGTQIMPETRFTEGWELSRSASETDFIFSTYYWKNRSFLIEYSQ